MKKIIQVLTITILLIIISLFIIFFFNPLNLRNKLIGTMINFYFQTETLKTSGQTPTLENKNPSTPGQIIDKNPLLSEEQEQKLESFGVDVESLPKEITPSMSACLIEKVGQTRANEIIAGAMPGPLEILKSKECLSQ